MATVEPTHAANATMQMSRRIQLDKLVDSDKSQQDEMNSAKSRNKDLQKTKLCIYHVQGMCNQGNTCQFAHSACEMRQAPNLAKTQLCTKFMNGNCFNENCSYAHGEAELVSPPNYKKKMCHWHMKGKCRNGTSCGFAHNFSELAPGAQIDPADTKPTKSSPPGLDFDWDASTVAPSSRSAHETDISVMSASRGSMPDENLHRMMAQRGSAPLRNQVASMGMAIADLQAKLTEVEGKMSETQAGQMKNSISQLSQQCGDVEARYRGNNQHPARPAAKRPGKPSGGNEDRSAVEAQSPSQVRKPRPKVQSLPPAITQKVTTTWWQKYGTRSAMFFVTLLLMLVVELKIGK